MRHGAEGGDAASSVAFRDDRAEAPGAAVDAQVLSDVELLASTDGAWVAVGRAYREQLDRPREVDRREA